MEDFINLGYKVNAIITDLPQGLTHNKWDSVIPRAKRNLGTDNEKRN